MSLKMPQHSGVQIRKEKDKAMLLRLARRGGKKAQETLYREYAIKKLMVNGELLDLEKMFGEK